MIDTEILNYAVSHGMIDMSYVQEQIDMKKREETLGRHPYSIWFGKDNNWHSYMPDEKKGRVPIKRKNQKDLENIIIDYWEEQETNPTIRDVFEECYQRKLHLEKISKSTYDRYLQSFDRHYQEFGQRHIKSVTQEEFEEFLEEQIPEHNLNAKSFALLKTVTNGFLKRAKKRKLISFNVRDMFDELEVSDKDFKNVIKIAEEEVFTEAETPEVFNELYAECQEHRNLLSLGLLLLFVTGARIGELPVLKWAEWDGCAFQIRRTETRYRDEKSGKIIYAIKEYPKTPAGVRSVIVPPSCLWIVDEIKKINPFGEYVFSQNGTWIKTYSFRKKLYRVCRKIEIVQKSPNKARKTYASILLDNSIPEKNIIELMGHTDVSITKEFYSKDRKSNAMKAEMLDTIPEFHIGSA